MKHYGIDCKGYLKIQDVTDPANTWNVDDDRKLVRDDVTGDLYIGNTTAYQPLVIAGQTLPSDFTADLDLLYHKLSGLNTVPMTASTYTGSDPYGNTGHISALRATDRWLKLSNGTGVGTSTAGIRIEDGVTTSDNDDVTLIYDTQSPDIGINKTKWQFIGGGYVSWDDGTNVYGGDPIATHSFLDTAVFNTLADTANAGVNPYFDLDNLDQRYVRYSSLSPVGGGGNETWSHWRFLSNDLIGDVSPTSDATASRYVYRKDEVYSSYVRVGPVTGTVTENNPLTTGGGAWASKTSVTDTIVQRDGLDIYCGILYGTASTAKYADLAEKYTCDESLPVGTVVEVSNGTDDEVVPVMFALSISVVGVVSESPAYLMNSDSVGLPIALTGKVPVRVIGEVRKGDFIVPAGEGLARKGEIDEVAFKIGVVLKTDLQYEEKLVECIIK